MDCGCIKLLSMKLRASVRLLQHLHLDWDTLLCLFSNSVLSAVLLLSPLTCSMCLLHLLTTKTLIWPPFCIGHILISLNFLWLSAMRLIFEVDFSFEDLILGFFWLSQDNVGRFYGMSFTLLWFLATLVPRRFYLCCLSIFGGPKYHCLANRLCLIMLFFRRMNPLLSINQFYYSYYLFQKASLCPRVLNLA